MPRVCPTCQTLNEDRNRFCCGCGRLLAATNVQGRTVVMNLTAPGKTIVPADDTAAIIDRARKAFGDSATLVGPRTMLAPGAQQREHLLFVGDVSGSMDEPLDARTNKLDAAKQAMVNTILQKFGLDPEDQIGLITFNDHAKLAHSLQPLREGKTSLTQAVQQLVADDGTDINAGLRLAKRHFRWGDHGVVRRIVLMTDGHGGEPLATAEELKSRGVIIDVVGIGPSPDEVNEPLLKQVASTVQGELRYRFIKDHATLSRYYTRLGGKTATNR
jgi:Mg-chelatase subunit ChlD